MRCHICDKQLTDKEGAFNKDLGERDPCSFCLESALDAAYTDGFEKEDDKFVLLEDDNDIEFVPYVDHKLIGAKDSE